MKILCVLGEHNYGNPARGESYEYVNFLPALRNLGHEVSFFESFDRSAYRDFADLNRSLLERISAEKPEIVLCVLLGYEVWLETLHLIREHSDALLINWSTDDSWKYEQFSRFIAPAFHLYATTYPEAINKAQKDGHDNFYLTQWAANSLNLSEPLPADQCKYSVSFIGSAYGNRSRWVSNLAEMGIHVDCFGYGWENGPVPAEMIPIIMRSSVISLSFGDSGIQWKGLRPVRSRQIKARTFEVPGSGGFLITEAGEGLDRFYQEGTEVVTFEGLPELAEKIRFYRDQSSARDSIASAGYVRTRNEHVYEKRFSELLETAALRKTHLDAPVQDNGFKKFDDIERKYKTGLILKLFRGVLQFPCVLIWGKERGPRAARRILFELSWRLVGEKTYSVSGWPGRLFYKES